MGSGCTRHLPAAPLEHPPVNSNTPQSKEWLLNWVHSFRDVILLSIKKDDGSILFCNSAWQYFLGHTLQDIQGKKLFDFVYEEDRERMEAAVLALDTQPTMFVQVRLISTLGDAIAMNATTQSWNNGMEVSITLVPITEENMFENMRQSNQDLRDQVHQLHMQLPSRGGYTNRSSDDTPRRTLSMSSTIRSEDEGAEGVGSPPSRLVVSDKSEENSDEETEGNGNKGTVGRVDSQEDRSYDSPGNAGNISGEHHEESHRSKLLHALMLGKETNRLAQVLSRGTGGLAHAIMQMQPRLLSPWAMMKLQFARNHSSSKKLAKIAVVSKDNSITHIIRHDAYKVLHCTKEMEVLRLLELSALGFTDFTSAKVDVVVIDVDSAHYHQENDHEPPLDGFQVFLKIRQKYFPNELPIIFLTTRSPSEEPRLLEANDFVKKPSNENEIMSKIKNMIYLKKLNDVQTRFVPREFLDLLGCTTLTDIHLGNHVQKFMSVLFCDIRGFTALSETLTGAETFDFINQFLAIVGPIVRKHQGFIDKFLGDGTLALFPKKAVDAVAASLEIVEKMKSFRFKDKEVRVGIGINSGSTMVGIIGEAYRLSCDVISKTVNLASRVESLTKYYGVNIILTEATYQDCKESLLARKLDKVSVVGIPTPVQIFEALGPIEHSSVGQRSLVQQYHTAWHLYIQWDFAKAMEDFAKLKEVGDKPSCVMYERCREFLQHPPPPEWDQVWVFKNK